MQVDRQLEKQAKRDHPGLLSNLPGEKKAQLLKVLYPEASTHSTGRVISVTQQTQTSPVPPPDFLEGYNRHIPNGADRLFTLVEKQTTHRIALEDRTVDTNNKATLRGQWMAIISVFLMSGIGVYALYLGAFGVATLIFGGTMLGIAGVFISGKRAVQRSLDQKRRSS